MCHPSDDKQVLQDSCSEVGAIPIEKHNKQTNKK
jgi:hypothetical protein